MPERHLRETSTNARGGGNGLASPACAANRYRSAQRSAETKPRRKVGRMTGQNPNPPAETTPNPAQQEPAQQQAEPTPAAQPTAPAADPAPAAEPAAQPAAPGTTMSVHKHQREMAKVEAERDAAKAEAEGYKKLEAEFAQWKADQEQAKTEAALKEAGCHDVVAASARLGEFDGDIEKLKEAAPYLFTSSDKSKSTGGNPKGTPDPEDERTKKMRALMGIDTEKE